VGGTYRYSLLVRSEKYLGTFVTTEISDVMQSERRAGSDVTLTGGRAGSSSVRPSSTARHPEVLRSPVCRVQMFVVACNDRAEVTVVMSCR
jgi:hypothetical protein